MSLFSQVAIPNGNQFFLQFLSEGSDHRFEFYGVGEVSELFRVFLHIKKLDAISAMLEAAFQLGR